MSEAAPSPDLLRLTARIVSAHASHNSVAADALSDLIRTVHAALENADAGVPGGVMPQPAVPTKKSVFPNYIVCLEDGKRLKMLKRHLFTSYKMTPQQYRKKWGLPDSYPMVAPNYAAYRSTMARGIGLGRTCPPRRVRPAELWAERRSRLRARAARAGRREGQAVAAHRHRRHLSRQTTAGGLLRPRAARALAFQQQAMIARPDQACTADGQMGRCKLSAPADLTAHCSPSPAHDHSWHPSKAP